MNGAKRQCKESVMRAGEWRATQCLRNAKQDGYCSQHHPDARAARDKASALKWEEDRKKTASHKLAVAGEKIRRVREEVITPLLEGEYLGTQHDVGKKLIRIVGLQTKGEF